MRNIDRILVFIIVIVITFTNHSIVVAVSAEDDNVFLINYYENDEDYYNGKASSLTTEVMYGGDAIKTYSIYDLGYQENARVFLYWKAHRDYDDKWYVLDENNNSLWMSLNDGTLPEGYSFCKYANEALVSRTSPSGSVQFIAQWDYEGNPISFYDSDEGSLLLKTVTLKYNVETAIPTAKELGLRNAEKIFIGWKVQREKQQDWRVKNTDGITSWASSLSDNDDYYIYADGIKLSAFRESGSLNFYAQWVDADFDVTANQFGANGNDEKDDSVAIQKALDMARLTDERITVYVPQGDYYLANTLYIYSNTELILDENATIMNLGETRLMLLNMSKTGKNEGGYDRSENIVVRGGKWDGSGQAGDKHSDLVFFIHAKNITIKDVTFVNCCGNHFIEFAGVKDSSIEGCTFKDFIPFKDVNYDQNNLNQTVNMNGPTPISEAIQLDYAADKNTEGAAVPFDGTVCNNVIVKMCSFDNCLSGIGNHYDDDLGGDYYFINNSFTNIKRNCFNLFSIGKVVVTENSANNVSNFVSVYNSYATNQGDILISSNTVINESEEYKDCSDSILSNESQGITVSNNKISGFQNGVVSNQSSEMQIISNTITSVKECGIKVIDTKSCDIKYNQILDCGLYNIATYRDCSGTIEGNTYDISYGIINFGKMIRNINQYKNLPEEPDYFTIYYHYDDIAPSSSVTTNVTYGTITPYKTIEELDFYTPGKKFLGWKIYRKDLDCWFVKDKDGNRSWEKTIPNNGSYVLYGDRDSVATTADPGGEVHFYAQWEDCDSFTIFYHSSDTSMPNALTTSVKYNTPTKYLSREDLGYWIDGKEFLGWKAYRCDTMCWYVRDENGNTSWKNSVPVGGDYELYDNEGTVLNIANGGADVHFYAQWKDTDSFSVFYFENDHSPKSSQKTIVKYGELTKYLTIEQLGFYKKASSFLGWKLYRPDNKSWYVQDASGVMSWKTDLSSGDSYVLYSDGGSVAKTAAAGGEVYFYAVWEGTNMESGRQKGDINGDGKLNAVDLLAVKSHIKKIKLLTGDSRKLADINGDCVINATDLLKMKAHIKGINRLW